MRKQATFSIVLSFIIIISSLAGIISNSLGTGSEPDEVFTGSSGRASRDVYIETDPMISTMVPYTNQTVYLNDNLTIINGGTFKLVNSTLIVNKSVSPAYDYKIFVGFGGSLILMKNSTIKNQITGDYELEFGLGSTGTIEDSTIENCGYTSGLGIYVRSNDVTFSNSYLDSNYNGINCFNATPTIINSDIYNSRNSAIICNNSEVTVSNTIIKDSWVRDVIVENASKLILISTPISALKTEISDSSVLEVHWWLTVNVTTANGTPIEGALVEVWDKHGSNAFAGETDANGQVTDIEVTERIETSSEMNESTPHIIKAVTDGYILGQTSETIESDTTVIIALELKPKVGTITGTITNMGNTPQDNVNVTVKYDGNEKYVLTIDGKYTFTNLPPGTNYTINVSGTVGSLEQYEDQENDSVSVQADGTTIVNFKLVEKPLPVTAEVEIRDEFVNADDAVSIDADTRIKLEFKYPMDNTTINDNNVELRLADIKIPITIRELDSNTNKLFELEPDNELDKERKYTIVVKTDVRRVVADKPVEVLWANFFVFFTTEVQVITGKFPADGASEINTIDPIIYVTFHNSIELNQTSLDNNFRLNIGNFNIPSTIRIDEIQTGRVYLEPIPELSSETTYDVIVSDSLRDLEGNILLRSGIAEIWTFTTKRTKTEITGQLLDKDNNKPIVNAKIKLILPNGSDGPQTTSDQDGNFSFMGLTPDAYTIEIKADGYKTYTKQVVPTVSSPEVLGEIPIEPKAKTDDEGIDTIWIVLIIVIIIIILIFAMVAMRKPKPREVTFEEEEYAEERVTPSASIPSRPAAAPAPSVPTATRMAPPPSRPMYEEGEVPTVPTTTSMRSVHRCPVCAHKLLASGECFHCKMDQMYGRY
jgi:hypothetical protein